MPNTTRPERKRYLESTEQSSENLPLDELDDADLGALIDAPHDAALSFYFSNTKSTKKRKTVTDSSESTFRDSPVLDQEILPRVGTEDLSERIFGMGFDMDMSRVPSWQQPVSSSSTLSLFMEPFMSFTRKLSLTSRTSTEDSNTSDASKRNTPPVSQLASASRSSSRSVSNVLRAALDSFGGYNGIKKNSPTNAPSFQPQVKVPPSIATDDLFVLAKDVTEKDILCDLTDNVNHEGNKSFHRTVKQACKSRRGKLVPETIKEQICSGIVNFTLNNNGRFLKYFDNVHWIVMSRDDALLVTKLQVSLEIEDSPVPPLVAQPQLDNEGGETVLESHIRKTDILCGRGGKSNHHEGNKWYRDLIARTRPIYQNDGLSKKKKTGISNGVVDHIHMEGGRFLQAKKGSELWIVMSRADARKKAAQLLRESKELKWTVREN